MNTIVTITGPSCSGKSTLARYLNNHGIPEVQSFTTRERREGELVGRDAPYRYVTREWVEALPQDELIEKIEFKGNYYGNTHAQMEVALAQGNGLATVVVEPNGVRHWNAASKQFGFRHFSIYLDQSKVTLLERFIERLKTVPLDKIDYELIRLQAMLKVEQPDWPTAYPYDLIVTNLGTNFNYSGVTSEMILGFLKINFQASSRRE